MARAEINFYMRKYYNELYESYSQEIYYLRIKGSRLLQKIKLHEIKMNKRKQQNLKPYLKSIDLMIKMIGKLVKISAIIETYRYFQLTTRSFQQSLFDEITNNYYNDMLKNIVLKIKRLNQSKLVDFTVIVEEKSYK